jgi:hypothetical protein
LQNGNLHQFVSGFGIEILSDFETETRRGASSDERKPNAKPVPTLASMGERVIWLKNARRSQIAQTFG